MTRSEALPKATHRAVSGGQVELAAGPAKLWIAQVGASMRLLQVEGRDVLDGYGRDEIAAWAQGQVLVPWPNRLADGRYGWEGETLLVALSEPEKRDAIPGRRAGPTGAWCVTSPPTPAAARHLAAGRLPVHARADNRL